MDLKYHLARAWLLRDRSPLPITTLEVIKDFSEFVTLASSELLHRALKKKIYFIPCRMREKGTSQKDIHHRFNVDLLL